MNIKTILGLVLVFSVVTVIAVAFRGPSAVPTADAAPNDTAVLVAAKPIPAGTLLRAEDVRWEVWKDAVGPGFYVRDTAEQRAAKSESDTAIPTDVFGSVVRQRFEDGQPIISADIVKPGDRGFLAAVLMPGYRAISVAVTAVSGGGGLIFPGDRVDVLLTQSFTGTDTAPDRRSVSETVVQNLRVLAIDQRVQQSQTAPTLDGAIARTVTLEVAPRMAESISVASELGKLSLILRSLDSDTDSASMQTAKLMPPTWASDVSPALRNTETKKEAAPPPVKIMHGSRLEDAKQ